MKVEDIPCHNCIILPICKQRCRETGDNSRSIKLALLYNKCSILLKYLLADADAGIQIKHMKKTIKVLKRTYE